MEAHMDMEAHIDHMVPPNVQKMLAGSQLPSLGLN